MGCVLSFFLSFSLFLFFSFLSFILIFKKIQTSPQRARWHPLSRRQLAPLAPLAPRPARCLSWTICSAKSGLAVETTPLSFVSSFLTFSPIKRLHKVDIQPCPSSTRDFFFPFFIFLLCFPVQVPVGGPVKAKKKKKKTAAAASSAPARAAPGSVRPGSNPKVPSAPNLRSAVS